MEWSRDERWEGGGGEDILNGWCLIETNSSPEFELIYPRNEKEKVASRWFGRNRFRKLPSKFPPIESGVLSGGISERHVGDFTVMNMTVKLLVVCCVSNGGFSYTTDPSFLMNSFSNSVEKRIPNLLNDVISCWRVPLKSSNSFRSSKLRECRRV